MKYQVRILPQAEEDIERNAKWWAEHRNSDEAVKWFFAVRDQLESLGKFPSRCPVSAENDDFDREIRDLIVGPGRTYRAVFTIEDDVVNVLAVRRSDEGRLHSVDFPTAE
ncbi:MAG: plasmid stabilization system protein ParE [Pirellulaceae bacterium]|jgi:plasmid stabilization system protein ParE